MVKRMRLGFPNLNLNVTVVHLFKGTSVIQYFYLVLYIDCTTSTLFIFSQTEDEENKAIVTQKPWTQSTFY